MEPEAAPGPCSQEDGCRCSRYGESTPTQMAGWEGVGSSAGAASGRLCGHPRWHAAEVTQATPPPQVLAWRLSSDSGLQGWH